MTTNTWKHQQEQLSNAHAQGRLSHAYLLSGAAGLGKTDFAREFAGFLLCEHPAKTACKHCRGCKQFLAGTHPDFFCIQPEEKSKVIKIDQIRELSQKISQTAHSGGYQIAIISPADAMPVQAANALLKTLEEPTGKVLLFLVDDEQHVLPATIASRCQRIIFSHEKNSAVLNNQDSALREAMTRHLQQIIERDVNPITPISTWIKNDLAMMLDIILLFCMDISRAQHGVDAALFIDQKNAMVFSLLSEKIAPEKLQQFIIFLNEKKRFLSQGINLNAQLCLENIMIEYAKTSVWR